MAKIPVFVVHGFLESGKTRFVQETLADDYFSGGERKKSEILQLRLLEPKLAMLDETDSGLDVDAVRIVSKNISEYHNENNSILLITHLNQILQLIKPDVVHILIDGQIVREGGAELADEVEQNGFDAYRLAVKGDGNDEA